MNNHSATLGPANADTLHELQKANHSECLMCGESHENGFRLEFSLEDDGAVVASFFCSETFTGYQNMIHGGVICSLLDSAMTNCLFAYGYAAVTAKLDVRFRNPVRTGRHATVRAWMPVTTACGPIFEMKAKIEQQGKVVANANGVFVKKPASTIEKRGEE